MYPLLGWPENEVTTSSRDAEMNTADSTSAVNFKQLLLNWLCKARKEVVVSLPNFLCILISRSLPNLKLKYTKVFKHKRIHNCITHSKVSRNIMAADAKTFHNYRRLLHHTQYARSFKMMYCVLHAAATT